MILWTSALALADPAARAVDPRLPPLHEPAPIVGGQLAAEGEAPEVGALFVADLYGCTGVLIAPDLVISAGHCQSETTLDKSVVLGALDHTKGGERIAITEDWRMPDHLETYDVALFALEREASATPARLLRPCDADDVLVDGIEATILGYGATDVDGAQTTTQLHRAVITVDDADCSEIERGCRSAVSPGGELRAGGDGVDSCVGDSGGPLYVGTPDGRRLAGITSRGALPAPTDCGNGGLYVRADAIFDWIEQTSGRTLPGPRCEPEPPADTGPVDSGLPAPAPRRCGCATPGDPLGAGVVLVGLLAGFVRRSTDRCEPARPGRTWVRGARHRLGEADPPSQPRRRRARR